MLALGCFRVGEVFPIVAQERSAQYINMSNDVFRYLTEILQAQLIRSLQINMNVSLDVFKN